MKHAGPPHTRLWLIAVFAIALSTALIWLDRPDLTRFQNPGAPSPTDFESAEATLQAALQAGQLVPDFELADLDGAAVRFSSLSGRPVIINFWATWCAPCRAIAPIVKELAGEYGDQVNVVKMDIDSNPGVPGRYGVRAWATVSERVADDVEHVHQMRVASRRLRAALARFHAEFPEPSLRKGLRLFSAPAGSTDSRRLPPNLRYGRDA